MDSPPDQKADPMKHCQDEDIRVCTKCGSTNITINGDTIFCNDCNAVLCFEHKK